MGRGMRSCLLKLLMLEILSTHVLGFSASASAVDLGNPPPPSAPKVSPSHYRLLCFLIGSVQLTNVETAGSVTASANAATADKQSGIVVSSIATLAAGSSNTITVTNSRVTAATTVVLVSMLSPCATGMVYLTGVVPASGSFAATFYNGGTSACTSTFSMVSPL